MLGGPRNAIFLGHVIQNELLEIMVGKVKEKIQCDLHEATFYTDETKDISKKEQLSPMLRYVYKRVIYEQFLGYVHAAHLDAATLTDYIMYVLSELEVGTENCVSL